MLTASKQSRTASAKTLLNLQRPPDNEPPPPKAAVSSEPLPVGSCKACEARLVTPPWIRRNVTFLSEEFHLRTTMLKSALIEHRPALAFTHPRDKGRFDWQLSFYAGHSSISTYRHAADAATEDLPRAHYRRIRPGAVFAPCPVITRVIGHKRALCELLRAPDGSGGGGGGGGGGRGISGGGGGGGGVSFFPECYVMPQDRERFAAATASDPPSSLWFVKHDRHVAAHATHTATAAELRSTLPPPPPPPPPPPSPYDDITLMIDGRPATAAPPAEAPSPDVMVQRPVRDGLTFEGRRTDSVFWVLASSLAPPTPRAYLRYIDVLRVASRLGSRSNDTDCRWITTRSTHKCHGEVQAPRQFVETSAALLSARSNVDAETWRGRLGASPARLRRHLTAQYAGIVREVVGRAATRVWPLLIGGRGDGGGGGHGGEEKGRAGEKEAKADEDGEEGYLQNGARCFTLMRFDVVIDRWLNAHLLEVNCLPDLYATPDAFKGRSMVASTLRLLGVDGYDRQAYVEDVERLKGACRASIRAGAANPRACASPAGEGLRELDERYHSGVWERVPFDVVANESYST